MFAIDIETCRRCGGPSLATETALVLDGIDTFFLTDDSIGADEARRVAALYLAQTGTWGALNRISKQGDEYLLQFGRRGCACSDQRTARILTVAGEDILELGDKLVSVCA